jgi:hypothetical protein
MWPRIMGIALQRRSARALGVALRGGPGEPYKEKIVGWSRVQTVEGLTPTHAKFGALLAHEYEGGFAFEVDVRVAADVHGYPVDGAACEGVGGLSGVVVGDGFAVVPAHV